MVQTSAFLGLREHLDKIYPLVEQPADSKQAGTKSYRTRHGDSHVCWSLGRPQFVLYAVLSDGSRVDLHNAGKTWRYRISDRPRRWIHGVADIRPDGVTFTPSEQPKYRLPAPARHPDLEIDLANDRALRERLIDDDYADALYAYIKNGEFFKEGCERIWSIGLSSAAGIVADLRGQGDVYSDFYPHGGLEPLTEEGRDARRKLGMPDLLPDQVVSNEARIAHFEEITRHLARLGWRRPTAEDKIVAAAATRRDLASWEDRPARTVADWAAKIHDPANRYVNAIRLGGQRSQPGTHVPPSDKEILTQRLYVIAKSGRISESEYRSMEERIALVP